MTEKTKKIKKEKKYTLLELIRKSEIDNHTIIGVLTDAEYQIYCNELSNDVYEKSNKPRFTKKEFNKIIKKIGAKK